MAKRQFQFKDTSVPVYLHFNHEKFFELTYDETKKNIHIRTGRLSLGDIEDNVEAHILSRTKEEAESMINSKLEKGYEILKKANASKPQYSITVTHPEEDLNDPQNKRLKGQESSDSSDSQSGREPGTHKRKIQESLMHEDQKKVRTTAFTDSEKKQNKSIISNILSSGLIRKSNGENKEKKIEPILVEEPSEMQEEEPITTPTRKENSKPQSPVGNGKKFLIEEPVPDINTFKGDYLTNVINQKIVFCKVQVLDRFVKVEHGVVDNPRVTDVQFLTYKDQETAETVAKRIIFDKTMQSYKPFPDSFVYNFKCSEVGLKEIPIVQLKVISNPKSSKNVSDKLMEEEPKAEQLDDSNISKGKPAGRQPKKSKNQLSVHHKDFDAQSDSNLSPTFDLDDFDEPSKRKEGKRSRSQAKSASPERRSQSTTTLSSLRKYSLGESIKGCYHSLLDPYPYEDQDVKGWFMSENLDGVRCFWDGKDLWLRKGKKINPPYNIFH